jgi:hypothetical protein
LVVIVHTSAVLQTPAERVASLIDPRKLATLAERGANPRVQKYVAQLWEAQRAGDDPAKVATKAVALTGMRGDAARLTVEAMLRNLHIAGVLGCLNEAGLAEMRRGRAPTITTGPYAGDQLSVDHIIPMSVAPQLDKVIANLELMPLRMNQSKRDAMGARQADMLRNLRAAGLTN